MLDSGRDWSNMDIEGRVSSKCAVDDEYYDFFFACMLEDLKIIMLIHVGIVMIVP